MTFRDFQARRATIPNRVTVRREPGAAREKQRLLQRGPLPGQPEHHQFGRNQRSLFAVATARSISHSEGRVDTLNYVPHRYRGCCRERPLTNALAWWHAQSQFTFAGFNVCECAETINLQFKKELIEVEGFVAAGKPDRTKVPG